jgi:ubiquinone/menaquinone biosynthesis C-methylase UbiE
MGRGMVVLVERKGTKTRNLAGGPKTFLMRKFIEDKIIKKRTKRVVDFFEGFVEEGEKILDIGTGGGWVAKELEKRKKAKITLLDVTDFNQTDSKLVLYDGKNIPFADNHFDTSLLIFVLHHCLDPLKVLKEAKRVSRRKIIVIEDVPTSWLNKIFLCFWDILSNLISILKPPGEIIAFNFKSVSRWQEIFKEFNLKTIGQKEYRKGLIHQVLFVLEK